MRRRTKAAKLTKYMQENPNAPVAELIEKFKASKQSIYNTRYKIRKQHRQENPMVLTAMVTSNTSITDKTEFIMPDPVNHPAHYTDGGIETIDFIEAKRLGYHLGNVVKYICRAGKKGTNMGLQDLQKARWYLDRAIEKNEINPPTR
jgi:hypothetical protein